MKPQSQFQVTSRIVVQCYVRTRDICLALVAVSHLEKMIVVAFRGSDNFNQVFSQFRMTLANLNTRFIEDGQVQTYYTSGFNALWLAGLENEVGRLRSSYPTYKFLVTGHSLGGALASLASLWMIYYRLVPSTQLFLYTFGMPRVGDEKYVILHDRYVVNNIRVTNIDDPIPHFRSPKVLLTFPPQEGIPISIECTDYTDLNSCYILDYIKKYLSYQTSSRSIESHRYYLGIKVGQYCIDHQNQLPGNYKVLCFFPPLTYYSSFAK